MRWIGPRVGRNRMGSWLKENEIKGVGFRGIRSTQPAENVESTRSGAFVGCVRIRELHVPEPVSGEGGERTNHVPPSTAIGANASYDSDA